jgi:hypothetical protein
MQNKKAYEYRHHRSRRNIRPSLRNGFTVSFALSQVTGLFCHLDWRKSFANVTPASGRQDHTTSPSVSMPFVKGISTSIASRSAFVTIASRPSVWSGTRLLMPLILASAKAEYFSLIYWTGFGRE